MTLRASRNATSSRAHTVLMVEFKAVSAGDRLRCDKSPKTRNVTIIVSAHSPPGSTRVSMINLVDLAGSEKALISKTDID